jgi:DMSO/TMAO reductase YedYZ molybdopterin-dependent catalytic subunit
MSVIPRTACAFVFILVSVLPVAGQGSAPVAREESTQLAPDSPYDFSVEGRTLDTIDELGITGTPIEVDLAVWRLAVNGSAVTKPASLSYDELSAMPRVSRVSLLVCPGFFEDVAEWGGVPIADLLVLAGASPSWKEIVVTSVDGYSTTFRRNEVDTHILFVALTVNGQVLPKEHGFPARLVAEGILGGDWVKWVTSIEVR